jgi:plasmid maintenance system antidote protein VapI
MGWGTTDGWMTLQMNYDLAKIRARAEEISVAPILEMS